MRRRVDTEISINHERWLVSYSDFMTLLFAFFVVLYSISQVNENKYKDLAETMSEVFNDPKLSIKPIQIGEVTRSTNLTVIDSDDVIRNDTTALAAQTIQSPQRRSDEDGVFSEPAELSQLSDTFTEDFSDFIDDGIISVNSNEYWLEISLSNRILFALGSVKTSDSAQEVLREIADILKPFNNPVQVEGYTDNLPVSSIQFPSNWELSSARASAIVKLLVEGGVSPQRLSAVGHGKYHPIAENDTPEGREKNRRVVLMIAKEKQDRPKVGLTEAINETGNSTQRVDTTNVENTALQNNRDGELSVFNPVIDSNLNSTNNSAADPVLDDNTGDLGNDNLDPLTVEALINESTVSEGIIDEPATIEPVTTESGGLLFSSDPNR